MPPERKVSDVSNVRESAKKKSCEVKIRIIHNSLKVW
jgi:hypothetical protein